MGDRVAPYVVREGRVESRRKDEIWVGSNDGVTNIAGSIATAMLTSRTFIDLACIGAASVNQAVKAVAVARQQLEEDGIDLFLQPYWSSIERRDAKSAETRVMLRVTKIDL